MTDLDGNIVDVPNPSGRGSGYREKGHWERQIIDLGGQNYTRHFAKMTDLDGNIVDVPNPSGRGPGYRYFGAAKKFPGVRELFEKPPTLRKRRSRYDIFKRIDASYYGYRDDEDGILCYYIRSI
ncbi:hypothetical protein IFM89_023708 [Coptis chinensis]|uniref:Uncharacterized protein n=1 Tax=Coptis chinensis TaxID=261450 RepID=A0A835I7F0_9MAGN|nr:hypothetical protein IFM89_023708 [Coptis chinensis]